MRKFKEVILEGLGPIRMQEMTVSHFPGALKILKHAASSGGNLDVQVSVDLVLDHYDEAVHIR